MKFYPFFFLLLLISVGGFNYLLLEQAGFAVVDLWKVNASFIGCSLLLYGICRILIPKAKDNIGFIFMGLSLMGFAVVYLLAKHWGWEVKNIRLLAMLLYFSYFGMSTLGIVKKMNEI